MQQITAAVHGRKQVTPDPEFEAGLAAHLKQTMSPAQLLDLLSRHVNGAADFDALMRRVLWKCLVKSAGAGLRVGTGVGLLHPETFSIGDNVFIGAQSFLQGRIHGNFSIGHQVWIGPHSYFDARDLVLEDFVGWGPGAKVLGAQHTGDPMDVPITQTDLHSRPVLIKEWADIGTNAVILPGITVGKGAIVGAGSVVTHDVPDFAIVAGVPARLIRMRTDPAPKETSAGE